MAARQVALITNCQVRLLLAADVARVRATWVEPARVGDIDAGEIIQQTDSRTLFRQPLHPYTQGLIGSVPIPGQPKDEISVIPGMVPNLMHVPGGCRFAPRRHSREEYNVTPATDVHPELRMARPQHTVRCWLYQTSPETADWKPPLANQVTN